MSLRSWLTWDTALELLLFPIVLPVLVVVAIVVFVFVVIGEVFDL